MDTGPDRPRRRRTASCASASTARRTISSSSAKWTAARWPATATACLRPLIRRRSSPRRPRGARAFAALRTSTPPSRPTPSWASALQLRSTGCACPQWRRWRTRREQQLLLVHVRQLKADPTRTAASACRQTQHIRPPESASARRPRLCARLLGSSCHPLKQALWPLEFVTDLALQQVWRTSRAQRAQLQLLPVSRLACRSTRGGRVRAHPVHLREHLLLLRSSDPD